MEKFYVILPGVPPGFDHVPVVPAGAILDTRLIVKNSSGKTPIRTLMDSKSYAEMIDFKVVSSTKLEEEYDVDGNYYYNKSVESIDDHGKSLLEMVQVKRDYCTENGISRLLKTITKGRYVITLEANPNDSANLHHDMYIRYTDEAGGITEFKDKPKAHKWPHINSQIRYMESYMKFLIAGAADQSGAIREFLNTSGDLSLSEISVEAGLNPGYLENFLNRKMHLTESIIDRLTLVLKKYGFKG